jgi:cbb3-type cytochrome oxidase maturation protein
MNVLVILIPVSIILGALGLCAFLWTLRNGQYEDADGAAARVLLDDNGELPED